MDSFDISDYISDSVRNVLLASFTAVGAYVVAAQLLKFTTFLFSTFLLSGTNLNVYKDKKNSKGTWAVVTGASSGIGAAMAPELAAKGFNLVLIARTVPAMEKLAKDVNEGLKKRGKPSIETKIVKIDLASSDEEQYVQLKAAINELDIGILFNNAGVSHHHPTPFTEMAESEMNSIIEVNVMGTLRVTRAVLPQMQKRKARSLVLTMGSFGGLFATGYLATYSGSKAFLQQWSTALAYEMRGTKVDVQLVLSHMVTSPMSKIRRAGILVPNEKTFVKSVLRKVGCFQTAQSLPYTVTPYWQHAMMQWTIQNTVGLGEGFLGWFVLWINSWDRLQIYKLWKKKAEKARIKALEEADKVKKAT